MKHLLLKPLLALSLLLALYPLTVSACGQSTETPAKAQASKTYDANGKLIQKTNDQGRHYNAKGQYQGKTTSDGKHYDAKGKFTGKTVASPAGSKSYDAKGKLLRKTDGRGRIYDATGTYQGKVKPVSPVKIEKRDAKGRLVEVKKTDDPGR
jgi:YD repeat-containing protein